MGFQSSVMVFHSSCLVLIVVRGCFMVFRGSLMVVHGFWLILVFHNSCMVFHIFWLVFNFHGFSEGLGEIGPEAKISKLKLAHLDFNGNLHSKPDLLSFCIPNAILFVAPFTSEKYPK